ncbi:MAG: hypothetical protein ACR2P5_04250, partial [Gammaproteobacteria bacterium]
SRNPASGEAAPLSPAAKVSAWWKTLDSGFRRNDGGGSRLERLAGCGGISAFAGMTGRGGNDGGRQE